MVQRIRPVPDTRQAIHQRPTVCSKWTDHLEPAASPLLAENNGNTEVCLLIDASPSIGQLQTEGSEDAILKPFSTEYIPSDMSAAGTSSTGEEGGSRGTWAASEYVVAALIDAGY